jgi:outer membrane autotransporter protein
MKRRHLLLAMGVAALLAAPDVASAQTAGLPFSCEPTTLTTRKQTFYSQPALGCARASIGRLLLLNNVDVIRRVTAESFGMGPAAVEAAGLADLTPEEAAAYLGEDTAGTVAPTADVVATPAASKFNLWTDGKYTWNDSSPAVYDLDGALHNLQFGIDYKLTSRITLGVMGTYENSHLVGVGVPAPDLSSSGWGVGPYFGVTLTPNIVWSGNFIYTDVSSDQNGFYNYTSDRYQAATAVTGYYYRNTWRFSPSLSLTWSKEYQTETAGLVADETIEQAIFTPSLQVGDTLRLGDRATVEPWLGAAFDYTFVNRVNDAVLGNIIDNPTTDIRLQAGLNFGLGSNMQLALTGELGGLLLDNTNTYAAEANLAIQF